MPVPRIPAMDFYKLLLDKKTNPLNPGVLNMTDPFAEPPDGPVESPHEEINFFEDERPGKIYFDREKGETFFAPTEGPYQAEPLYLSEYGGLDSARNYAFSPKEEMLAVHPDRKDAIEQLWKAYAERQAQESAPPPVAVPPTVAKK